MTTNHNNKIYKTLRWENTIADVGVLVIDQDNDMRGQKNTHTKPYIGHQPRNRDKEQYESR